MLKLSIVLAGLLVAPALLSAQQEAPRIPDLDAEEIEELLEGEAISSARRNDGMNRAEVVGFVQAPRDEVFEIISDFENLEEWFPDMRNTVLISDDVGQGETHMPWPIADRDWQLNLHENTRTLEGIECRVAWFDHVEGSGNVDDTFGYWLVYTWPDDPTYTVIRYVLNADIGVAVPNGVINWASRRLLPGAIEGIRERHAELY